MKSFSVVRIISLIVPVGLIATILAICILTMVTAVYAQGPTHRQEAALLAGAYDPQYDVNHNGIVDIVDLQLVAGAWNGTGSPVLIGQGSQNGGIFTATNSTGVGILSLGGPASGFSPAGPIGVLGDARNGKGVFGISYDGVGVYGLGSNTTGLNIGVYGQSNSAGGYGVQGRNANGGPGVFGSSSGSGPGVVGTATHYGGIFTATTGGGSGIGVSGSGSLYGVLGRKGSASSIDPQIGTAAVHGDSAQTVGVAGSSDNSPGVLGQSKSSAGVWATSDTFYGVYAESASSYGILGSSTGSYGIFGSSDSSHGLYAESQGTGVNGAALAAKATGNGIAIYSVNNSTDANLVIEQSGTGDLLRAFRLGNDTGAGLKFRITKDGTVLADGSYNCGLASGCFNTGPGADIAERIDGTESLQAGDLVEIDPDLADHYRLARTPYSTLVAGVISTQPGVTLNNADLADNDTGMRTDERPLLALVGRVPVKVSAENGAIHPGDLLVASSMAGHAMLAGPNPPVGTVIGKSLGTLPGGTGTIPMLVMLR
ncbi:MAG: hypothetical protein HY326_06660 [Chloroflexi bacterium]|nr:hypothetical protein [Chloroflexota bacterium]